MGFSLLNFFGEAIKPIAGLVDKMHTSDEERLVLQTKLQQLQMTMTAKLLDHEKAVLTQQAAIIKAEAQGGSWLQRNWRPITMLTFLVLVVCDQFGLLTFRLADEAWTLLQVGIGGYVVGRSAEKIAPNVVKAIKTSKG